MMHVQHLRCYIQEDKAKTKRYIILRRGSCAVAEPCVLGGSQCVPAVQPVLLSGTGHYLVWMGSLDLLEHGQPFAA